MMNKQDIKQIALLHRQSLPGDILPNLGQWFLQGFYQYVIASNKEKLICIKQNDEIIGISLISFDANTIFKRSFINYPLRFSLSLLWALRKTAFRQKFRMLLWHQHPMTPSPQIAFIFTAKKNRGQGIGQQLIKESVDCIRVNQEKYLYVKTLLSGQAMQFYEKNRFTLIHTFDYAGEKYALLRSGG